GSGPRLPPRWAAPRRPGASNSPAPSTGSPPSSTWRAAAMSDATFGGDPAQDLYHRWRRGERPDVRAFLASLGALAPTRLAAVFRVDQRERWAVGERVTAADYLGDFPALRDDPEAAIEVIFGEFLLREERGEVPDLGEYQRDHPEYAGRLAI